MANKQDRKILDEALERFKQANEAEQEFRRQFTSDLEFVSNDQWEPLARQQRTQTGRPCNTYDRINPALRQIVNEERQNRPSIQVDPTGGGATVDVANILAGLIRHIEQDSNAEAAYDTAGWYAAAGGVGYLRIRSEYDSYDTFEQKLKIESIADPMSVFMDPFSVQPDGSDANWAFIVSTISKDEFEYKYPDSKMLKDMKNLGGWKEYDISDPDWLDDDTIRIAEYFYKDHEKRTLYNVMDTVTGETIVTTERPPQEVIDAGQAIIMNQRPTYECKIRWCLMTSEEILEQSIFEGNAIPVVPVIGESYFVNGKRFKCGAVFRAKDAQKTLNFAANLALEILDLNAKAPYIGAAGAFDTFESNWAEANRKNFGYLEYNTVDINGNPVPPPQRNAVEAPVQAATMNKQQAEEDIRAIFGVTDPVQEAQRSQISGVAILARKQQQSVSNYHYYDNLVRSVKHIGRILVNTIPVYYDTPRMVRIVKPNGEQEIAAINQMGKNGRMIDLSVGKYDVVVQTGPSYSSKRQEQVEAGIALITAFPASAPYIADLVTAEMDGPGSKMISKRLQAMVPPEAMAATNEQGGQDADILVPQLQSQLRSATQNLQALNAHAGAIEQELKVTKDEMTLLKMKQNVELKKAELDQMVKMKGLELDEQRTELEFLIKEQEIIIQKRQMDLEEKKLALMGIKQVTEIEDKMFDQSVAHIERVATMKPGEGELSMGFDAVEGAAPSDLKEPSTGLGNSSL